MLFIPNLRGRSPCTGGELEQGYFDEALQERVHQ